MCGIAGVVNLDKRPLGEELLRSMADAEAHRGPDDSGVFVADSAGLCHRRLSIIDLSKDAHQPMPNEDSRIFIVHNGEIYNYIELAGELKALGHAFRSKSDTEVILHAYEEWGEDCLKRFNGMWAFAILDLRKDVLFCSRDRFGVKPFYYFMDGKVFAFSSEIKALLRHPAVARQPNDRAIFTYLASGYGYTDTSDETFFSGIRQLKPAHYLKLSIKDKKVSQERYWDIDPAKKIVIRDEDDIYRKFLNLFQDSIRLRLRSDVPVGVSLSGGLDSSSIACVTAQLTDGSKIESFSSCFDESQYDERKFIKPVLEKTGAKANFIFTKPEDLFGELDRIIWHQEEPYSTLSIFPQWSVMRLAREKGIKVLLTGQGGDETLGGYDKYYYYLFADLLYSLEWKKASEEMGLYGKIKGGRGGILTETAKIIASNIMPHSIRRALPGNKRFPDYMNEDFARHGTNRIFTEKKFASILNNDLYNALKISPLPSLLHIDDRSSMAHSVESRAPFLDYRLVEFLFSLGPEFKIREGQTKYVLRRSLKGILPDEVRTRSDKMGFATPLEHWFRTSLKESVSDILQSRQFRSRPYFNAEGVDRVFGDFVEGKKENLHFTVWGLVNLELWLRKFFG
jgi:asparagine synthase (glutamine-hydrolysing)